MEALAVTLVLLILGLLLAGFVLGIVAQVRIGRLVRRVGELESRLGGPAPAPPPEPVPAPVSPPPSGAGPAGAREAPPPRRPPIQWELLLGQKAAGWTAVALLVLAAAFFLRHAFEHGWIDPLGRVALGAIGGAALLAASVRSQRRGLRVFAQMLGAAGLIVLYLAIYGAFGFYCLLPQSAAGAYMALVVVEGTLLALAYDSLAMALVAVAGGLAAPVLLHAEQDAYRGLFAYLAALDAGVVVLLARRAWPAIGLVALAGTQAVFFGWHAVHYHPEKRAAALAFQGVVLLLWLVDGLRAQRAGRAGWEALARWILAPLVCFGAAHSMLDLDHHEWMGSLAIGLAVLYAALSWAALSFPGAAPALSSLALSGAFVALTVPLQAEAAWIPLGWAALASLLWWFGLRVRAGAFRALAFVLAATAVARLVGVDLSDRPGGPFWPVANATTLPALGTAACLLLALALGRGPALERAGRLERGTAGAAFLAAVLLVWLILSADCLAWADARGSLAGADRGHWERVGQTALSVLWAAFATAVLAAGFLARRASLRWLALALYALTAGKVLLVDMAELAEIYRILAFLAAAIFLGAAARAYQRLAPPAPAPAPEPPPSEGGPP